MKNIGRLIRELREKSNDTLEELASKLDLTLSALSKIELGHREAKLGHLEKIASIYEVPLSYFFGEEGELPTELKNVGVEWITFAQEMKERKLTPEQIKAFLEFMDKMGIGKKI